MVSWSVVDGVGCRFEDSRELFEATRQSRSGGPGLREDEKGTKRGSVEYRWQQATR